MLDKSRENDQIIRDLQFTSIFLINIRNHVQTAKNSRPLPIEELVCDDIDVDNT